MVGRRTAREQIARERRGRKSARWGEAIEWRPPLTHRIRPATGPREVLGRVLLGSPEVADHGAVGRTHIARGAVEVPGAPGGVGLEGNLATPVAVLRVRHARSKRKQK